MNFKHNDIKEARSLLKNKQKIESYKFFNKNILEWTVPELKEYIKVKTKGMKPAQKMKFSKDILLRIETEKKTKKEAY